MKNYYNHYNELLQGRCKNSRRLENNTYVQRRDSDIVIKYHDTDIIRFKDDEKTIIVDCSDFRTVTTRQRLSAYLPVNVSQKNYIWYIGKDRNNQALFFDGIELNYNGDIISDPKLVQYKEDKKTIKIKKDINKYCNALIKFIDKNGVPMPNSGDCWDCSMRTENNITLGDSTNNHSHLLEHIKENYIHGSLIYNALTEAGYNAGFIMRIGRCNDMIKRSVRKYLIKRLVK